MKKYIKPSIDVAVLSFENAMMAGSVTTNGNGEVQSVSGSGVFDGGSGDVLGNDGGSTWDDQD